MCSLPRVYVYCTVNCQRYQMIFKSQNPTTHMLYQGFHLCCLPAPDNVTCPEHLEGIQDLMPQDVETVRRWIQTGMAPPPVLSVPRPEVNFSKLQDIQYKAVSRCRFSLCPFPLYTCVSSRIHSALSILELLCLCSPSVLFCLSPARPVRQSLFPGPRTFVGNLLGVS